MHFTNEAFPDVPSRDFASGGGSKWRGSNSGTKENLIFFAGGFQSVDSASIQKRTDNRKFGFHLSTYLSSPRSNLGLVTPATEVCLNSGIAHKGDAPFYDTLKRGIDTAGRRRFAWSMCYRVTGSKWRPLGARS